MVANFTFDGHIAWVLAANTLPQKERFDVNTQLFDYLKARGMKHRYVYQGTKQGSRSAQRKIEQLKTALADFPKLDKLMFQTGRGG